MENTASTGSDHGHAQKVFPVNCNDYMFGEIASNNCMYIIDLTSGSTSGWICYGPSANSSSAEFIVERPTVNGSIANLSNFGTETMYNLYDAVNAGNAVSIGHSVHNYSNMYQRINGQGNVIARTGPITGSNIDTFAVTWESYN